MNVLILIHSPFHMWNVPDGHVQRLVERFPQHRFFHARDDREALPMIEGADAAFSSQINLEHLQAAPRLRWIHSPSAGIAGMLYPQLIEAPVVLTNSRGISGDTIAEHVLAVTLALMRRLPLAFERQAGRVWAQNEIASPPGNRTVAGSTVVVIGLGSIGAATARRLAALGATVIGVRRRFGDAPQGASEVHTADQLLAVVPRADVVVVAAPQTRDTRGLIGADVLAAMKPGALLVNVSRGGLVDEQALAAALRSGHLGGAALDVFRDEPLGPDSVMWGLPNLLITPHTSGFRHDHWDAVTNLFAENLQRFERDEQLINVVDKKAGY